MDHYRQVNPSLIQLYQNWRDHDSCSSHTNYIPEQIPRTFARMQVIWQYRKAIVSSCFILHAFGQYGTATSNGGGIPICTQLCRTVDRIHHIVILLANRLIVVSATKCAREQMSATKRVKASAVVDFANNIVVRPYPVLYFNYCPNQSRKTRGKQGQICYDVQSCQLVL